MKTQQPTLSYDYYPVLKDAKETLDIKVKCPWPGQVSRAEELHDMFYPEHILVRKARDGIACRVICLESESYRGFFRHANDPMGESPYFEEAQKMIAGFEKAGGLVRRISGSVEAEISFAIADSVRAVVFVGAWTAPKCFERHAFPTKEKDADLVQFLSKAFDLCWKAI